MSYLLEEKLAASDDLVKELMSPRKDVNKSKIILNSFDNFYGKVRGDLIPLAGDDNALHYNAKSSGRGLKHSQYDVTSDLGDMARKLKESDPNALKEYDDRIKDAVAKIRDSSKKEAKRVAIPTAAGALAGGGLGAALAILGKRPTAAPYLGALGGTTGITAGALGGLAYAGHKKKKARKNLYQKLTDDEARKVLDAKNEKLKNQAATGIGDRVVGTTIYYY